MSVNPGPGGGTVRDHRDGGGDGAGDGEHHPDPDLLHAAGDHMGTQVSTALQPWLGLI